MLAKSLAEVKLDFPSAPRASVARLMLQACVRVSPKTRTPAHPGQTFRVSHPCTIILQARDDSESLRCDDCTRRKQ